MSFTTSNNLELVNLGGYVGDPSSDDVIDLAKKFNANLEILDPVITQVNTLETELNILIGRGGVDGFLNGGIALTPTS